MKILGLGNALVDVLSKLDSDETLVKIGIQKGAMDMISREQTSNLIKLAVLVLINLCIICLAFYRTPSSALVSTEPSEPSAVDTISQYGSQSDEVTQIQTRLKSWGYFSGPITGYYGTQTTEAVKKFQETHGLTATGVADEQTLELIGLPTTASSRTPLARMFTAMTMPKARAAMASMVW